MWDTGDGWHAVKEIVLVAIGVNNAEIRCGEEYAPLWKETKAPNPGESGYRLPQPYPRSCLPRAWPLWCPSACSSAACPVSLAESVLIDTSGCFLGGLTLHTQEANFLVTEWLRMRLLWTNLTKDLAHPRVFTNRQQIRPGWWLMSVNPTFGRLEQEDYHESVLHSQFGASLGYRVRMELELGGGSQW